MPERKAILLCLDPAVHDAVTRCAADELRSVHAQIELLIRNALSDAGRAPLAPKPLPAAAGHPTMSTKRERR